MTHAAELLYDIHKDIETKSECSRPEHTVELELNIANAESKVLEWPPFACNVAGRRIRHAMTGAYYQHCVGSRDELRYFKVCNATGLSYGKGSGQRTSNWYFFDSPDDFRNRGGEVARSVANDWCERRDKLA